MISDLFQQLSGLSSFDGFGDSKYKESVTTMANLLITLQGRKDYAKLKDVSFEDPQLVENIDLFLNTDRDTVENLRFLKARIDSPDLPDSDAFTLQMMGLRKE